MLEIYKKFSLYQILTASATNLTADAIARRLLNYDSKLSNIMLRKYASTTLLNEVDPSLLCISNKGRQYQPHKIKFIITTI